MIKATNLTKRFDNFTALDSISCEIGEGTIYGLVGSNGAGKSTLIRALTGVYRADGGEVTLDGAPIFDNPAAKARIAYVPDELFFLPNASMDRMSLMYESLYPRFSRERYRALAERFDLDTKKSVNTFSKGMRRQAATALSLATCADYVFFDETFDGLDPIMRLLVKNIICEDMLERGATTVITSHSLRELEGICDNLAFLHQGGLVLQSDVETLQCERFKIQIAFNRDYDRTLFEGIDLVSFEKNGSVASLIVKGGKEEITARLTALSPVLLDILPLTLEEVFTYEMEVLGYSRRATPDQEKGGERK